MTHDMTTIVHPINLLVSDELDRASKLHGEAFASEHEGYGVIAEEVLEAGDELEKAESLMRRLLIALREEKKTAIIDLTGQIKDIAVNCAAECVQVAAMCEKMLKTIQEAEK